MKVVDQRVLQWLLAQQMGNTVGHKVFDATVDLGSFNHSLTNKQTSLSSLLLHLMCTVRSDLVPFLSRGQNTPSHCSTNFNSEAQGNA